jgi:pimeloyl-ACP methyl ester carboxylesterase
LILADTTSFRTFLAVRTAWNPGGDHIRRLRELAMPKLIISGAEDRVLPAALSQSDAEAIGARFHVLQRTGHFPTLDEPEAVARLVENTFGGRNGDK